MVATLPQSSLFSRLAMGKFKLCFSRMLKGSVVFLCGDTRDCFLQVIFTEPVVIAACEFLEQSASSVAQAVTLVGYVFFWISFYLMIGLEW